MVKRVAFARVPLLFMGAITAVTIFGLITLLAYTNAAKAPQQGTPSVFLPLVMSPSGMCYYVETDDAVVIEMESIPTVEQWQLQTGFPDYTGSGYYVWTGPDYLAQPGIAVLSYPISLTKSGTYRLNIRNSHPLSPTDFNDVWVRLDDRPWIKGFSNVVDTWTYDFNFDYGGGHLTAAEFFNVQPGLHTLELSARSAGFRLDRLVLSTNGMGQLDTWPESPCVP
ncbi:MAG TPA: hypothetical protein PLD25_20665 [Chloroflexota bacterium]|nr:hypothetical protein [Chloroflexota bacterium]